MDHSFYTDRLSAYFDQELKHEEHVIVDEHVRECEECQKILADLEKFDSFVEENSGLAENDYWEKSAQKIEAAISGTSGTKVVDVKKESSYKGLWWKVAGVAATIGFIAFISLYESEITDQIENKYTAPPPPAEILEESDGQKQPTADVKLQEEPKQATESEARSKEVETEPIDVPQAVPDNIAAAQEKPAASAVVKKDTKREATAEGASEAVDDISLGRVDKDAQALSLSKEIPQKTAPSTVAPQKSKLVVKSAEADEAEEMYEMEKQELRDEASSFAVDAEEDSEYQKEQLTMWQNTVVTQNNLLSSLDSKKSFKSLTNGLAASGSKKDTTDKKAIYNELFEAYYNVALLSKDSLERKNALLQLNNYANDPKFQYQNTAKLYLNQFDSVQNIKPVLKRNKRK